MRSRSESERTAIAIGALVADFCGLLVGVAIALWLLGLPGCSARDVGPCEATAGSIGRGARFVSVDAWGRTDPRWVREHERELIEWWDERSRDDE